jgi:hypothetical protein
VGPGAGSGWPARERDAGPRRRRPSAPCVARQARELAREVYGRHEGVWPDHGDDGGHDGDGDVMSDTDSEGSGSAPLLAQAFELHAGDQAGCWLNVRMPLGEAGVAVGEGASALRSGPPRAGRLRSRGRCSCAWQARQDARGVLPRPERQPYPTPLLMTCAPGHGGSDDDDEGGDDLAWALGEDADGSDDDDNDGEWMAGARPPLPNVEYENH